MVALESLFAATISPFLTQIVSRPLSRNKSSKIRVPLTDAKLTVISAVETLRSVQDTLDRQMHEDLFENCQQMDLHLDGLLKASNKNMNILTKTRRYREMVKEAREAHAASLNLAFRVQEASLTAQVKENNKPANIKAKAEEAAIAYMERKVRYDTAKKNYQKLCGPGFESRSSFKLTLQLEVDTPNEDEEYA